MSSSRLPLAIDRHPHRPDFSPDRQEFDVSVEMERHPEGTTHVRPRGVRLLWSLQEPRLVVTHLVRWVPSTPTTRVGPHSSDALGNTSLVRLLVHPWRVVSTTTPKDPVPSVRTCSSSSPRHPSQPSTWFTSGTETPRDYGPRSQTERLGVKEGAATPTILLVFCRGAHVANELPLCQLHLRPTTRRCTSRRR